MICIYLVKTMTVVNVDINREIYGTTTRLLYILIIVVENEDPSCSVSLLMHAIFENLGDLFQASGSQHM